MAGVRSIRGRGQLKGTEVGTSCDAMAKRRARVQAEASRPNLADALSAAGVGPNCRLDVARLRTALRRARKLGLLDPSDREQLLFSVYREAFSGDEVESFKVIRRSRREAIVMYEFAQTGSASVGLLRPGTDKAIREWVADELGRQRWTPAQFTSAEIVNSDPRVLPRSFFVRLLAEATARSGGTGDDLAPDPDGIDEWLSGR